MERLIRLPARGAVLALANALFWVFILAGPGMEVLPAAVAWVLALVMSLPIAVFFIVTNLGRVDGRLDAVMCVAIGVNSLLWGYGVSWMWSKLRGVHRPAANDQPERP